MVGRKYKGQGRGSSASKARAAASARARKSYAKSAKAAKARKAYVRRYGGSAKSVYREGGREVTITTDESGQTTTSSRELTAQQQETQRKQEQALKAQEEQKKQEVQKQQTQQRQRLYAQQQEQQRPWERAVVATRTPVDRPVYGPVQQFQRPQPATIGPASRGLAQATEFSRQREQFQRSGQLPRFKQRSTTGAFVPENLRQKGPIERADIFVSRQIKRSGLVRDPQPTERTTSFLGVLSRSEKTRPFYERTVQPAERKFSEFFTGVRSGVREQLVEKPVTTAGVGALTAGLTFVGGGVRSLPASRGATVAKTAFSAGEKALVAGYAGTRGSEVLLAPTPEEKGKVVGRTIVETGSAVGGAALAAPTVPTAARLTERAVLKTRLYRTTGSFKPNYEVSAGTFRYVPLRRSGELVFGRQGEVVGRQSKLYPQSYVESALRSDLAAREPARLSTERIREPTTDIRRQFTLRAFPETTKAPSSRIRTRTTEIYGGTARAPRGFSEATKGEITFETPTGNKRFLIDAFGRLEPAPRRSTQLQLTDFPSTGSTTMSFQVPRSPPRVPLRRRIIKPLGKKGQVQVTRQIEKPQDPFETFGGEYYRPARELTTPTSRVRTTEPLSTRISPAVRTRVLPRIAPLSATTPSLRISPFAGTGTALKSEQLPKQLPLTDVALDQAVGQSTTPKQGTEQLLDSPLDIPPTGGARTTGRGRRFEELLIPKITTTRIARLPKFDRTPRSFAPSLLDIQRRASRSYTPTLWGKLLPKIRATKSLGQQAFSPIGVRPDVFFSQPKKRRSKKKK